MTMEVDFADTQHIRNMIGRARVALLCVLLVWTKDVWGKSSGVKKFPKNFEFGASTAAYQIEGGWAVEGKGLSIWDIASHTDPSPIVVSSTGDIAADSYHQYKRDVELMKELGLDFYRFSIAWTRILPSGLPDEVSEAGIQYYNNLIDEMIANHIRPVITMYHWDLPFYLQKLGGWVNPEVVTWFVDYAKILFDRFGDRVQQWITINDPKQICYEGYGSDSRAGALPLFIPVLFSIGMWNSKGIAEYLCTKNVLLAHAKAYHLYNDEYRLKQNGNISISISFTWYEPNSDSIDDHQAALDARQFDWGQYAHPIFSTDGDFPLELKRNVAAKSAEQGFPRSRLPELSAKEVALIRGAADFLGVNSYTTKMAYRNASLEGMYAVPSYMDDMSAVLVKKSTWPQSESSWLQMVPWGFRKLLLDIKTQYNNPIVFITENGWSTAGGLLDEDRILYYRNYLNALLEATQEGCDIHGYSVWSLIDGFEWRRGYKEKFGLFQVDFSSPNRTRTPRKSAYIYKEIIRSRVLDPDYEPDTYISDT